MSRARPTPSTPAGSVVSTEITYTWDEGNLGGRFPSNPNVWWRYTGVVRDGMVGLRVGLLRIGSDSEDNNAITETSVQLPWRKLLKNVNTITEVRTAADGSYPVSVKDLSGWFGTYLAADNSTRAHTGLDTFKGEGFILNKPGNECISLREHVRWCEQALQGHGHGALEDLDRCAASCACSTPATCSTTWTSRIGT